MTQNLYKNVCIYKANMQNNDKACIYLQRKYQVPTLAFFTHLSFQSMVLISEKQNHRITLNFFTLSLYYFLTVPPTQKSTKGNLLLQETSPFWFKANQTYGRMEMFQHNRTRDIYTKHCGSNRGTRVQETFHNNKDLFTVYQSFCDNSRNFAYRQILRFVYKCLRDVLNTKFVSYTNPSKLRVYT
jgi:hypothetical protein